MTPQERAALRAALRERFPFLQARDIGPQAVAAGECDRCGQEPRMVQPCGPPPDDLPGPASPDWALGRRCAIAAGPDGWCEGHHAEAVSTLRWLEALPAQADLAVRLWWVATGEVRPDRSTDRRARALLAAASGRTVRPDG